MDYYVSTSTYFAHPLIVILDFVDIAQNVNKSNLYETGLYRVF